MQNSRRVLVLLAAILGLAGVVIVAMTLIGSVEEQYGGTFPKPISTFSAASPTPDSQTSGPVTPDSMAPNHLLIPKLGLYVEIVPENVQDGVLGIPQASKVGINSEGGTVTGKIGTVLVAGHVSSYGTPGALADLSDMREGYRWYVTDADGNRADFVTNQISEVHKADLPGDVFDKDGVRRGLLITCTGKIIKVGDEWVHEDNLLVGGIQVGKKLAEAE